MDVWSVPTESGETTVDVLSASVTVHDPERPGEMLFVECDQVTIDGLDLSVQGCGGSWFPADEVVDGSFEVEGTVETSSPTNQLLGTCTVDGQTGTLDLWRTS